MLVRIISSTNPGIEKYIGEKRRYFKAYGCACLEKLDEPGWGISTSRILEETEEGNIIKIKTKNSEYILEKVEGE
ncbi:MAG: hypothetical protein HFI09_05105 [Bacilli bacterium]|nr:hypothetical protein [Bacilli bacterium]